MKKRKANILKLLAFILLTSCGFSSGLYTDILEAQDHMAKREFPKAVEVYESILQKKPSKNVAIKINFQLGEVYSIYLNNYDKGIYYFQKIVEDSNEPSWQIRALEKLGNIYFNELKEYTKSEKLYQKLESFYPPLEKVNFYSFRKTLSKFHQKEYKIAIKEFDKIIDKKDENYSIRSYFYIGLAYFYQKDYQTAITNWFEYLKRESRKDLIVETKFLIANAYESSEKLKEAYNIYYSILGVYPNTEVIQSRLNSLYERRVARKR
ncbi:MAG: hypothetical protein CME62_17215 [Halobacteriovoraceae bacterium]|nr:hypothetical protein [Halobacteriovoraceae bacterium]